MNWFIGLVVDPAPWYDELSSVPPGLRAFHGDDLHLTIAFLGHVTEEQARAAWGALAWPLGPVQAELAKMVPMGSARRYSALSFLLGRGRVEIEAAMGPSRQRACVAAQVEPDARSPKAHLTVARPSRSASNDQRRAGLAWAESVNLKGTPILLDRVALYTWSDDRKERLFRRVEEARTIPTQGA